MAATCVCVLRRSITETKPAINRYMLQNSSILSLRIQTLLFRRKKHAFSNFRNLLSYECHPFSSSRFPGLLVPHRNLRTLSSVLNGGQLCFIPHDRIVQCRNYKPPEMPQASAGSSSSTVDPFKLVEDDLATLAQDIRKILPAPQARLASMAHHLFDGKGKAFRPMVALLMARACNAHHPHHTGIHHTGLLRSQQIVAMVTEMIHAASLVHDDVIDASDTRRGAPSLNSLHGQRLSILTGDYIMSQASIAISRTGNPRVIIILSTIMEDLVSGEFMQLGSKEDENERFSHYLKKTYRKTASLIANTCQSVAILADCDEHIGQLAFQYGRNLGIAFQLVDDLLDFTSCPSTLGKPTDADLQLGLATAPVLFAAQQHPELHAMIMRRFSKEGDVEHARERVAQSNGVYETRLLAQQHSEAAIKALQEFPDSPHKAGLTQLARLLLDRRK